MDGDCDLMELVFSPSPALLQFAAIGAGIESKVLQSGNRDMVDILMFLSVAAVWQQLLTLLPP